MKRRVLRWAILPLAVFALVSAIALMWLLHTEGGRDFALRRAVAGLPNGSSLHWQSARGTLAGPLTLRGVALAMPVQRDSRCTPTAGKPCATGLLRLDIAQADVDAALLPLLARRLRLEALSVRGARLELPRDDTPFELPKWPDVLPTLDLPIVIEADALTLDDVRIGREGEALLAVRSARGGLRVGRGDMHVEHLRVDSDRGLFTLHGGYAPRRNYRTDLAASVAFPARPGRPAAHLDLRVQGDLSKLDALAEGQMPDATRLHLTLADGTRTPRWRLDADSAGLDPGLLDGTGSGTPLRFNLFVSGVGGQADLRGAASRGDFSARLQPSKLQLSDQRLDLKPLVVDLLDGRITANGHVRLGAPERAEVDLALAARRLRWADANGQNAIVGDADLKLAGRLDQWMLRGQAQLARGEDRADVALAGSGDRNAARIERVEAGTRAGRLSATGLLAWSPALSWQADARLDDFDPGYFAPDWPGALRGRIETRGQQRNGALVAQFDARDLAGRLRGRALSGHATLSIDGTRYRGDVALALGASRIEAKGEMNTTLVVDAKLAPLQLDDLLPGASGRIEGQLALRGRRDAPDVRIDLNGQNLVWNDYRATRVRAKGDLPWARGEGALDLDADGVQAGIALDVLRAQLRGAATRLRFELDARGADGTLAAAGSARRDGTRWQGQIARLAVAPAQAAAWTLRAPGDWSWDGQRATLSGVCLQASLGGSLCARGGWPNPGLTLDGRGLPLALVADALPRRDDGRPWTLVGSVDLGARIAAAGSGWTAEANLASASGGLRDRQRARRDLFGYRDLKLDLRANPLRIEGRLGAGLFGGGRIDAELATGWDAAAPLSGSVRANTKALTWLELLSPDLVEPGGLLSVDVRLTGSRGRPRLGGSAQLQAFSAELPALGIDIDQGELQLQAGEDGNARIVGSAGTGKGTLRVEGSLGWMNDDTPLQLSVSGSNVLLADTRQLRLLASPALSVQWRAGAPVQVRGEVTIPEADIHLEKLEMGVSPSSDVVVLDPIRQVDSAPLQIDVDTEVRVGERVRIDGYGLAGTLSGGLRVRQAPGRDARATGALEVGGRYRAYGQNLQITRGRLLWSNAEIGDPRLDIRAERHVGDVTAGVAVDGRASRPQVGVYSNPAMSQSEALSYLTLGRTLSTLTGREAQQLGAARSALNAGAGLLAAELGNRIGLDDAGVSQSRALGGEVLGVGKYLSPRLYVSYGVALLGTGEVVTLKYLLKKGFDIQIESSSVQNRASVNWRMEK